MKKRSLLKKALGLGLCATMAIGAFTGCGNKGGESLVDKATSNSKEYVFRGEVIDLGGTYDCSSVALAGDRVYASTYSNNGFITIFSFNTDGSDIKSIKIPEADNEGHGYMTFTESDEMYSILNIYNWGDYEEEDGEMHIMNGEDEEIGTTKEAEDTEGSSEDTETETDVEETVEEGNAEEKIIVDTDPQDPGEYIDESVDEQQYLVKYDA